MENDLPTHLFSPGCSDDFAIVGGAGFELDTRGGFDVVELRGAGYSFREVEGRRMANGFHEEEPRSIYFHRIPEMSRSEEIYLKLSTAVLKMRAARKVARLRADENEKLPESARQPGRSEYIQVLQELQATGQSVLDDTLEADDHQLQMQGRARRPAP